MIIPVESNQKILKIRFWAVGEYYYPEMKITPELLNVGEITFTLKIDENFVVSYDFTVIETLESTQRRIKNFYANQKKLDTLYNIPQKDFINNLNINAVGIDLGMTRSCVGVNRTNGIELVAIDGSERQLPSYVSFKEKDPV
uniref:Uncharacterized protein n=1 Tax=Panagrolaimus davidi TaxID=227884 RepID=A0A914PR93_9BILA